MRVTVREIRPLKGAGNLKAFAVVEIGPWIIRGFRVVQQPGQRPYVALPQVKARDGRYFPVIQTDDTNLKNQIQDAVLDTLSREDKSECLL